MARTSGAYRDGQGTPPMYPHPCARSKSGTTGSPTAASASSTHPNAHRLRQNHIHYLETLKFVQATASNHTYTHRRAVPHGIRILHRHFRVVGKGCSARQLAMWSVEVRGTPSDIGSWRRRRCQYLRLRWRQTQTHMSKTMYMRTYLGQLTIAYTM